MANLLVWKDLFNLDPDDPRLNWQAFRPGVDMVLLHGQTSSGSSCALLRYQPGAVIPPHQHEGMECLFILRGSQRDERDTYEAGSFLINPKLSSHSVESVDGCVVLAIWERPVRFLDGK